MKMHPPLRHRDWALAILLGVGSLYYLMYAVDRELPADLAQQLTSIVFAVIATSILVHGISATPLMERYMRSRRRSLPSR